MIIIKEKSWKVYKHKNKVNGKVYIGITSRDLKIRSGKNGNRYNKSPHFWKAIQKYGWDNFEHIILVDNLTKEEACELEKKYISKYKSNDKNFGYNCSLGGESGNYGVKASPELKEKFSKMKKGDKHYNYGKHLSDEQKRKISETKKGVHLSEETKRKISETLRKHPPTKGRKMSDEQKEKLSKAKMGNKNIASKSIYCKELNKIYGSLREAERETGIPHENISKACRNLIKYAGKTDDGICFHWCYVNKVVQSEF